MKKLLERLREPSTWGGLGLIATMVFKVPQTTVEAVTQAGVAVAGAIAVFMPESKK